MYLLNSFIELVPAVTKKSADHYDVFNKANMSGMFRVNLAFFQSINTSKCFDYNIDFADIKQGHVRRHPPLLVKYLQSKGKGKKSSAQPQSSILDDAFKEFLIAKLCLPIHLKISLLLLIKSLNQRGFVALLIWHH